MTRAELFFTIMSFCNINAAKETDADRTKKVCFEFMNNCSVFYDGRIEEPRVEVCKDLWRVSKEKIIKDYDKN